MQKPLPFEELTLSCRQRLHCLWHMLQQACVKQPWSSYFWLQRGAVPQQPQLQQQSTAAAPAICRVCDLLPTVAWSSPAKRSFTADPYPDGDASSRLAHATWERSESGEVSWRRSSGPFSNASCCSSSCVRRSCSSLSIMSQRRMGALLRHGCCLGSVGHGV